MMQIKTMLEKILNILHPSNTKDSVSVLKFDAWKEVMI